MQTGDPGRLAERWQRVLEGESNSSLRYRFAGLIVDAYIPREKIGAAKCFESVPYDKNATV
jgi:hypothetical protein